MEWEKMDDDEGMEERRAICNLSCHVHSIHPFMTIITSTIICAHRVPFPVASAPAATAAVVVYISSSPPPSLRVFLFLRPGRPAPNGDVAANSMTFSLSTRTMNPGVLTMRLPTRM